MELSDETKKELLLSSKIIAVVGLSPKTDKPSNRVAQYLIEHGYKVIPVNPKYKEILEKNHTSHCRIYRTELMLWTFLCVRKTSFPLWRKPSN